MLFDLNFPFCLFLSTPESSDYVSAGLATVELGGVSKDEICADLRLRCRAMNHATSTSNSTTPTAASTPMPAFAPVERPVAFI